MEAKEMGHFAGTPFPYDDKWNELTSTSITSPTLSLKLGHSSSPGSLVSQPTTARDDPGACPEYFFPQGGNTYVIPVPPCSDQGTRRGSTNLLDTRIWSELPNYPFPPGISESQIQTMNIRSHFSHTLLGGGPNGFMETPVSMSDRRNAVVQEVSDVGPPFLSSMEHHPYFGIGPDYSIFASGDALASSPASFPNDTANVARNKGKPPMIYKRPEKGASSSLRPQRAYTVNIGGVRIDVDDLSTRDMINVHKCQWGASSNPCGMWIIGSRSHVGMHVRKWHHDEQKQANGATRCRWEGCGRMMLKDSINRHVLTVHLEERFRCQGCDRKFSRKDVYHQHVEDNEVCMAAGAEVMYGTERTVIDTRHVLHQEAVRCAGL